MKLYLCNSSYLFNVVNALERFFCIIKTLDNYLLVSAFRLLLTSVVNDYTTIFAFDVEKTHSLYTDWSRDCMGQR